MLSLAVKPWTKLETLLAQRLETGIVLLAQTWFRVIAIIGMSLIVCSI